MKYLTGILLFLVIIIGSARYGAVVWMLTTVFFTALGVLVLVTDVGHSILCGISYIFRLINRLIIRPKVM